MGYDYFFRFIKNDLIDPKKAFIQNVDNFLFCIYFGYLERYDSHKKEERNKLLTYLFRNIKSTCMVNIIKEELPEKSCSIYPTYLEEFIELKYNKEEINDAEMEVDLILYCILVNSLGKTKGKRFDKIKEEFEPLIKILKEIFCEFDKNEIHKERTFIFPLRSPSGTHDDFYIINGEDILKKFYYIIYDSDDSVYTDESDDNDDRDDRDYSDENKNIRSMYLHINRNKDEKDERKYKYYRIVLENSLHEGKKEHKL